MSTIFSFPPSGVEPERLHYGYLTDVMEAHSTLEQRTMLRWVPRLGLEFPVMTETVRETGLLQALIYAEQANEIALPLWFWGNPLTAGVGIGATSLPVSTVDIPWLGNGWVTWLTHAVLWRDPFTCELVTVTDGYSDPAALAIAPGTVGAWPAGTLVYPAVLATFDGTPELQSETPEAATGQMRFRMRGSA